MKIAIYQPRLSYYVGGGEIVPFEMARNFSKHGHEITIVTSHTPMGLSEYFQKYVHENPQIKYEYLQLPKALKWIYDEKPGSSQMRWDLESVHVGLLARDYFQKNTFDILNVHYKIEAFVSNPLFPTISFLHGVPAEREYFDKVWFSFENVKYVSVSEYIGRKWSKMVGGIEYKSFTNGIDTKYYRPLPEVQKDIDILYFGRLVPVKGVTYLVDAVKNLVDEGFSLRIVIAGKGTEKDALRTQVSRLKLENQIEFLGYVPQEDVVGLYNRSRMLVAPSFDREGVLTTMLEASACEVPTVTTNSCSMPEFIDDNINGLLAVPQNSDSLAKKIRQLLSDEDFRIRLGRKAREKAVAWDWDTKSKKLEEYYENVIKQ